MRKFVSLDINGASRIFTLEYLENKQGRTVIYIIDQLVRETEYKLSFLTRLDFKTPEF